jgi:NADPH:quinone reductase-like Zn-dependent oxidoreductase
MRAAFIRRTGPAEVIEVGELPRPDPGPREIRVRVQAAALNHVDLFVRDGRFDPGLTFPYVLGRDAVGVVDALGPGVTRFKMGDRVWSNCLGLHGRRGAFAEWTAAPEDVFWPLPGHVDPVVAAATLHSALTAMAGLERARLTVGERIFVTGGAGNVGQAVIALALRRGARVMAAAGSDAGAQTCRAAGAERAVNYRTDDIRAAIEAWAPGGLDVWWEGGGRPDLTATVPLMAAQGRIVVIAGFRSNATFPLAPFYVRGLSLLGFAVSTLPPSEVARLNDGINEAFEEEALPAPHVERVPLSATIQAQQRLEAGGMTGKIVLVPPPL